MHRRAPVRLAAAIALMSLVGCQAMTTQKNLTASDFGALTGSIESESPTEASDRFEAVIRAPRRGPGSSVEVALHPVDVDADLARISSLAYEDALRQRLDAARGIELYPESATEERLDLAAEAGTEPPLPADLIVQASAFTTDTYMVPGLDGKPMGTPMLVLEARIESTYDSLHVVVEERGPLARSREILERFTERVETTIHGELAPKLPIDLELRAPANRSLELPEEGFGNWRR